MTLHPLNPCANFLCHRLTTATYCCGACADADAGGYEIHEDGPLAHSTMCDQRHGERGPSTEYQRIMWRARSGRPR